jgi:hypothetical protein
MHCATLTEIQELDGIIEYPLVEGPFDGCCLAVDGFFSRPGLPRQITLTWENESATYALQAVHGPGGELGDLVYRFHRNGRQRGTF